MRAKNYNARIISGVGVFASLAILVSFATSFIKIQFLSLDAGDIIIVLASFIYGSLSGVLISLVSAVVSFLYSGTGVWGMLMDFISSAVFAFVASFIYHRRRSLKFAIIGIYSAVIAVSAVMIPMNILITPLYTGAPSEKVLKLIPALLLPFNFFKALFNGGAALIVYKPLVRAMRRARLIPPTRDEEKNAVPRDKAARPWLTIVMGGATVVASVVALAILAFA